ncbi:MAG TPA: hypothetical protein VK034_19145 [Enhygromyxa sp.]|nr:hypothetical protein [Enhygromyxa sp.]
MQRKRIIPLAGVLAALLLVGGWSLLRTGASTTASDPSGGEAEPRERGTERAGLTAETQRRRAAEPGESATDDSQQPTPRERRAEFDRARRDALRIEILQALAEQPSSRPSRAEPDEEQPRPPGTLRDRIGGRSALTEALNHDFIPLADECVEQARARLPELEGMVAIGLDTVADAELGGIVEAVAMQPNNEIDDPELIECLSQTALSMILPPPPESGKEQFVITMPIEPEPPAN